jgi:RNA polymerase sigma factor (sigma-70 family)
LRPAAREASASGSTRIHSLRDRGLPCGRELALRGLSDAEVIARCRDGDSTAWNELVDRYSRYVYAICAQGFRLAREDAEDVFQDVFAKVYEQLDRLRDDAAVRPWIAQLTRTTCIDRLRSSARHQPAELVEIPELDAVLEFLDDALSVRAALAGLPEACREMLDRFFARDESYRTIGEALDLPSGTIASRISRCLERLKAAMEETAPVERLVDR